MFKYQIISKLIEQNKTTKVNVAEYIGMSISGFNKIISGESVPGVDKLEKLADFFDVPTDYFFDRAKKYEIDKIEPIDNNKEIILLQNIIIEKERLISDKERFIKILLEPRNDPK